MIGLLGLNFNYVHYKKLSKIQQPLTCQQSNEARRTTKIRSVVERVFGALKKNEAIDNMRNTVLGHNAIDLRIASAFYNMTFKQLIDDKPNSLAVARRLEEKMLQNNDNTLQFLFHHRLSTQKYFYTMSPHLLDDFIQLKRKYLRQKIFFGSFHLKQAKSYLIDFIRINKAYVFKPPKKLRSQIENDTGIIGFKLTSRYKRSKSKKLIAQGKKGVEQFNKVHKVYIQYKPIEQLYQDDMKTKLKPGERKCDSIRGWICSCLNGRRTAGVCSHVATVIYFLTWARRNSD